jgi:hypothetical protein
MDYPDYLCRLQATDPGLAEELSGFQGIENVLDWMKPRDLCRAAVDIIGQDEFEYDFLLQLEPGGRWLAFGVTSLGSLTAVAVWPRKPTADELLACRLEDGWEPAPTLLQSGPAVLGHAACRTPACRTS